MNEKTFLYVIVFLGIVTIASLCGNIFQQGCIQRTRFELDTVRNELATARERERFAKELVENVAGSVERTSNILSESKDTVAGIRECINKIRKEYEEMANALLRYERDCDRD